MQHRRGGPYVEDAAAEATDGEMPIVLDDTDRIFTQTWLAVGNASHANTLRVAMKRRLNHPFSVSFGGGDAAASARHRPGGGLASPSGTAASTGLPAPLTLQTLRANNANASELLVRIAHGYALDAPSQPASAAGTQTADLAALLRTAGLVATRVEETTLTGMLPVAAVLRHSWSLNGTVLPEGAWRHGAGQTAARAAAQARPAGAWAIHPLEIRAWLMQRQ